MNADLIVKNANVITVDESQPRARAFAVYDGKFTAVSDEPKDTWIGCGTDVIDLTGKTVIPGFYDAHCHLTLAGKELLKVNIGPSSISSIDGMVSKLSEAAEKTPRGEWIQGTTYDDTKLKEARHPTRWDLDEASTDHPIFVPHSGFHQGSINSKAIEVAGWDENPPEFGEDDEFVERDPESDELTGIIREDAKDAILGGRNVDGIIPDLSTEEEQKAIRLACEKYNSHGITSIADMSGWESAFRMLMNAYQQGNLSLRVNTVMRSPYWEQFDNLHFRTGLGDSFLKIGPIKATADGAIASRTAYLSEPYEGDPEDYGDLRLSQKELDDLVMKGHKSGWQVAIHANGDKTIEMVLDAFERALEEHPREDHRHRIEHCTVLDEQLIQRIKDLNLVVNPFATYLYQHGEKMADFGDRVNMMFAHGSFLKHDIPVSGTTDNPAGLLNPLLGIQTMVTRRSNEGEVLGPEQRISVEEALKVYTLGSAYSCFEEDQKGSIAPRKFADFTVLSDDLTSVEPTKISDISVEKTFVEGECVYNS